MTSKLAGNITVKNKKVGLKMREIVNGKFIHLHHGKILLLGEFD